MNKVTVGYILMIFVMTVAAIISLSYFFMVRTDKDMLDINLFPETVGEWQGKDLPVKEKEYELLETRNLIQRDYFNPKNNKTINLFIIYSETNRSVFHPPEVCLMGSGVAIVDKKNEKIKIGKDEIFVNKLDLEKNSNRIISLYCYSAGNFYTSNFYLQQARFALNQIFGRHRGGATIRVTMRVEDSRENTLNMLNLFMKDVVKIMKTL